MIEARTFGSFERKRDMSPSELADALEKALLAGSVPDPELLAWKIAEDSGLSGTEAVDAADVALTEFSLRRARELWGLYDAEHASDRLLGIDNVLGTFGIPPEYNGEILQKIAEFHMDWLKEAVKLAPERPSKPKKSYISASLLTEEERLHGVAPVEPPKWKPPAPQERHIPKSDRSFYTRQHHTSGLDHVIADRAIPETRFLDEEFPDEFPKPPPAREMRVSVDGKPKNKRKRLVDDAPLIPGLLDEGSAKK